jgi:hypothetical protein
VVSQTLGVIQAFDNSRRAIKDINKRSRRGGIKGRAINSSNKLEELFIIFRRDLVIIERKESSI